MFEVIAFECDRCRQTDDDISEDAKDAVGHGTRMPEREIVTDFVYGERHGMIDGSAKNVGC